MMRIFYDLFFLVFGLAYVPYLFLKGKCHRDFSQKFGLLPQKVTELDSPIWIHAVSVGEAGLAVKLSAKIKERFPLVPVIISTTTRTGNEMVFKTAGDTVDAVFYYPVDISSVVFRVVRAIKPRLYVIVETELWPNLLEELHSRAIPVVLVNGRISDSSFRNYKKIKFIIRNFLRCIDSFCMQSETDAERIKEIGADPGRVFVTGNMKFDAGSTSQTAGDINRARLGFAEDDEILVAGSTHDPEEKMILNVYEKLKGRNTKLKLVLAPRHVERAGALRKYMENKGLKCGLLSDTLGVAGGKNGTYDILLVDTIGHLRGIYGIATLVFIGGSLVKRGGQNPIEAARWGKAVIFGPYMHNFRKVASIFLENGAACRVKDAADLETVINDLLIDVDRRNSLAEKARMVVEKNAGAIDRTVTRIAGLIKT